LTGQRMRAELLHDIGSTTRAYELAALLYEQCRATLPARHPATLRAAVLLPGICHHRGDLDTAQTLCEWVLNHPNHQTKAGGRPAGRPILTARVHLALVTADRGDTQAAIDYRDETLGQFRQRYGDHGFDTIRIAAHLAELHADIGQRERARRLLVRAHHDARARFGPDHAVTRRLDTQLAALEPPLPTTAPALHSERSSTAAPAPARPGPAPAREQGNPGRVPVPVSRRAYRVPGPRPGGPAGRTRPCWLSGWGLAGTGVAALLLTAASGTVVILRSGGDRVAQAHVAAAVSTGPLSSPVLEAQQLTITAESPGEVLVSWNDPSQSTAIPVLSLSTTSGVQVVTVTLPPGTHTWRRGTLPPRPAGACWSLSTPLPPISPRPAGGSA